MFCGYKLVSQLLLGLILVSAGMLEFHPFMWKRYSERIVWFSFLSMESEPLSTIGLAGLAVWTRTLPSASQRKASRSPSTIART